MTAATIRDRIASVVAGQGFAEAQTPFSFDLQPSGQIDQVFRIEVAAVAVIGGFNWTEERTDQVTIWLARTHQGAPTTAYQKLVTDVTSIRAGIVRDGLETSGEYLIPDDDWAWEIQREAGNAFAMARISLGVNYESTT